MVCRTTLSSMWKARSDTASDPCGRLNSQNTSRWRRKVWSTSFCSGSWDTGNSRLSTKCATIPDSETSRMTMPSRGWRSVCARTQTASRIELSGFRSRAAALVRWVRIHPEIGRPWKKWRTTGYTFISATTIAELSALVLGMTSTPRQVNASLDTHRSHTSRRPTTARLITISAAVALVSHMVFLLLLPSAWQRNQSTDYSRYYEPVAGNLAAGGGLFLASKPALLYPCGIPIMYAATFRVADTLHITRRTGLRLLEAFLLASTSVLITLTARLILSWKVALVASGLWSTYPFHLWLTKQPDPTSALSLLLLLSVFLFVKWSADGRRSVLYGCMVGLLLGIAALIKPITIALPAIMAGLACICVVPCQRRQRALFSSCVIVAYLIAISPWEIWARKVSGQWIPLGTNGPNVLIDGLTLGTVRGLRPVWMPEDVRALIQEAVEHYEELKTTGSISKFLITKAKEEPTVLAQFFVIKAARSWYGSESHAFERWVLVIQLLYLPFVIAGAREVLSGDSQQRNVLLTVTAITLYFWAITTFAALPVLRYLVPAISLVMIVAAGAFYSLATNVLRLCYPRARMSVSSPGH
jgi:Dolichyl-phosphate-mannose-protein mannosyltransferase